MIVKNQCCRCGRFPVLDFSALATSMEKRLPDALELRITAQETIEDLRCHAEECKRAPRRDAPEVALP